MKTLLSPALVLVRNFARDERGVTAIEFGILALPFFTIILAIIQTAIMFLASQVLDSAVEDAARRVRTGEAAAFSLTDFRNNMCGYTFNLLDCSAIQIKSQVIADFGSVSLTPAVQTCTALTCTWSPTWQGFDPGTGRSIIQVSAYYRYPLIVVLPYFNLKNQPDNYRLISAVRVFRNEPYS
ncbi:MAG: TadE/TadG family type IV pilus assembly protein [Devosia sp.]